MKKLKDILNEVLSEAPRKMSKKDAKILSRLLIRMSVESVIPHKDVLFVNYTNYRDRKKIIKAVSKLYSYDDDGRMTNAPRGIQGVGGTNWIAFKSRHNESVNEAKQLETKIFDQGALQDSMKQIRKLVGIEEADEKFPSNSKVRYSEFRFGSGEGGFSFKWEHGVKHFGRLGLSLNKDGNHRLYAVSYFYGKQFGDEKIDPKRLPTPNKDFLRHVRTWKDLDNLTMQTIITVLSKDVEKNESAANKALDQERQAQSDYYGAKADTGRIGYGLSSQPRSRR